MVTYVFDGTLEGLLTSVFEYYERKPKAAQLVAQQYFEPLLLGETLEIDSDQTKATRVWEGLKKKIGNDWLLRFYKAFLSEDAATFQHLFDFARYIFDHEKGAEQNFGHPAVIAVTQMERSVSRERHRMKAFIRFQETADGIFYAPIEPDFNVLPLISKFFQDRYANQRWIIYDLRRKYGLYYDLDKVEEIVLEQTPQMKLTDDLLHGKEQLYGLLWNDYFRSTNIPARKNMKLHIRHVPKRYWKYLTEKQVAEKLYFIAIIPPKGISDEVTLIKQDFASHYQSEKALKVVPHITLKAPFKLPETDHNTLLRWFAQLVWEQNPFVVQLKDFGSFPNPNHPVIFVKPGVSAGLIQLQQSLIKQFSKVFPHLDKTASDHSFNAHMTVAYRDLTPENFKMAWQVYQNKPYEASFEVAEIHLLQHDGTRWNTIARSPIAQP